MDCQRASVPKELLSLISMPVDGTDHTSKLSQATLTSSQLIVSNYRPNNSGNEDKASYHSKNRETPLVLYNALNLYGRFRSKCIITNQFHLGLSVPYLRVLNTATLQCLSSTKNWNVLYLEVHGKVLLRQSQRIISTWTHRQILQPWIIMAPVSP